MSTNASTPVPAPESDHVIQRGEGSAVIYDRDADVMWVVNLSNHTDTPIITVFDADFDAVRVDSSSQTYRVALEMVESHDAMLVEAQRKYAKRYPSLVK